MRGAGSVNQDPAQQVPLACLENAEVRATMNTPVTGLQQHSSLHTHEPRVCDPPRRSGCATLK